MNIGYPQLAEGLLGDNRHLKVCVTGDSMSPLLRSGNSIYIEPVRPGDLSTGDILLFKRNGNLICHRLVEICHRGNGSIFWTKGDTFSFIDDPLREREIVGRVYAVEKWGRVFNLKRGIFSILDRVVYLLSPLTSLLYSVRRWWKGFDVKVGVDERSKEERFLISLLSLDEGTNIDTVMALKDSVDLSKILELARKHGISQRLYAGLQNPHNSHFLKEIATPRGIGARNDIGGTGTRNDGNDFQGLLADLRRDYLTTAARNTLLYSEFKRVVKGLKEVGIKVIVMKGVALAELVYQDIGVRPMSDIDLLIKRQDLAKVDTVLEEKGYFATDSSPFDGIENPNNYLTTRDYRGPNPLHPSFHIHWHMVNSSIPAPYSTRVDMEEIWKDAQSLEIGGVPVLSMAPHHLLLHLSEHAMRVTHSASKLIYLLDVSALIKRFSGGLDWYKVVETSKRFGVDRFVYNVLALTELNTGVEIPGWVLDGLKSDKRGMGERLFYYITARGYGLSGLSYMVHLGMNKGFAKKASFLIRTLFPPAWVLVKRYPYPPVNGGEIEAVGRRYIVLLYLYRLGEVLYHLLLFPIRPGRKEVQSVRAERKETNSLGGV